MIGGSAVLVGLNLPLAVFDTIELRHPDRAIPQTVFGVSGTALGWVENIPEREGTVRHGQWGKVLINPM